MHLNLYITVKVNDHLIFRKILMVKSLHRTYFELVISSFKSTERVTCFSEAQ